MYNVLLRVESTYGVGLSSSSSSSLY